MKFTLFIPTLNEITGVKAIMPKIKKDWVDEILIVDGNSTDGTKEYLEDMGYKVITQRAPGVPEAWWTGFENAAGDVIIPFSPDGNSVPERIPELVAKMKEGYDMVICSRYKDNAKSEDDDWLSRLANFFFTKTINILYGAHYTDALGMYRAFKKELVHALKLGRGSKMARPMFEPLLSTRAAKMKLKIAEIPGDEPARLDGTKDSRAHPGKLKKCMNGLAMLYYIFREYFIKI